MIHAEINRRILSSRQDEQSNAKDATIGQLQAQLAEVGANEKATAGENNSVIQSLTKDRDGLQKEVAFPPLDFLDALMQQDPAAFGFQVSAGLAGNHIA